MVTHFSSMKVEGRLETYLIPGETLIPGGEGEGEKRFTLVLDMPQT